MLESLRSITRSCFFGENDPEMGSLIYDLKHQITDAGGTVLLVHHSKNANDTTGTEALSSHNAIAGAANTISVWETSSSLSGRWHEKPVAQECEPIRPTVAEMSSKRRQIMAPKRLKAHLTSKSSRHELHEGRK